MADPATTIATTTTWYAAVCRRASECPAQVLAYGQSRNVLIQIATTAMFDDRTLLVDIHTFHVRGPLAPAPEDLLREARAMWEEMQGYGCAVCRVATQGDDDATEGVGR